MAFAARRRANKRPIRLVLPVGGGASGTIQSFTLTETSGAASAGMARQGMAFKQGDVPAGSVPVIKRGGAAVAHQWGQVVTHADGSWKFAVFSLRDTAFSASQSRTYDVTQQTGSVPAGAGLALSSVLAAHDFKAVFTTVNQTDGTTTTLRASTLTASLATHAATSTRVTKMADGPVAPCWKLWGMAGADPHLKTESYLIPWLNGDGSVYAVELCMVAAQNWWSVASKYQLNYDAALMDGATTIASYPGVQHPYHGHWAMLRTTQDNNFCRAPWIGGAMPTLTYGFDKAYWAQCAAVPPFDTSLSPAAWDTELPRFVPCRGTDTDVENVDGTGVHGTRGVVTGMDGATFMRQGAFDYAYSRAFAQNAIHAPFHYRSNRARTRPGEGSADTANSVISLTMLPKAPSEYDFTSDGLPMAVDAYSDGRTSSDFADGYVAAGAGYGPYWSHAYPNGAHLYSYAYMSYLFDGSPWLLESGIIDWATFCVQQTVGQNYARRPLLLDDYRASGHPLFTSMPSVTYTGITAYASYDIGRAVAFAINLSGQAAGIVPDGHEAAGYLRKLNSHNGDWIAQSLQYMPASMKAAGIWGDITPTGNYLQGSQTMVVTPFMTALVTVCALNNYRLTGVDAYRQLGLMSANHPIGLVNQGPYMASAYRVQVGPKTGVIDFSTNDFLTSDTVGLADTAATVAAGSDTLTLGTMFNEGSSGACNLLLAPGDIVRFSHALEGGEDPYNPASPYYHAIPAEVNEGQDYYIVAVPQSYGGFNSGIQDRIKVSATPGGSPIVFSAAQDYPVICLFLRPASANVPVATNPPLIPSGDTYIFLAAAALKMAVKYGHPTAAAASAKMDTFLAPAVFSTYMPSALSV